MTWHSIIIVGVALAFAAYFKLALSGLDRGDGSIDEMDSRIGRLKRGRAERGECVYCGGPLGRVAPTLTASVCARCAPDVIVGAAEASIQATRRL